MSLFINLAHACGKPVQNCLLLFVRIQSQITGEIRLC
jgi:hypothetical protein